MATPIYSKCLLERRKGRMEGKKEKKEDREGKTEGGEEGGGKKRGREEGQDGGREGDKRQGQGEIRERRYKEKGEVWGYYLGVRRRPSNKVK